MVPLPSYQFSLLLDPVPTLWISGRGFGGGMRTQAKSSFPWKRVKMPSHSISTSLVGLFSHREETSSRTGLSAEDARDSCSKLTFSLPEVGAGPKVSPVCVK